MNMHILFITNLSIYTFCLSIYDIVSICQIIFPLPLYRLQANLPDNLNANIYNIYYGSFGWCTPQSGRNMEFQKSFFFTINIISIMGHPIYILSNDSEKKYKKTLVFQFK